MKRIFTNPWWVVVGATLGLIVGNGPITLFTFGVFLKPVSAEFGWDRGTVTLALAISQTVSGLSMPFIGLLIDRYGIRRVTLPSIFLFAVSVAAVSRTPASPVVFILLYAIIGLTGGAQSPLSYAKAISAWFEARRGLALGIAIGGVGLGTALMPQVTRLLIDAVGWRGAYVGLGILTFAIAFPAFAVFVREPETESPKSRGAGMPASQIGLSAREALKSTSSFWLILAAAFLVAVAVNGTIGHMVAIMTDRGISSQLATSMLTVSGMALIGGRMLSGYLADRCFAPYVAAGFFLLPLAGIVLLSSGAPGVIPYLCALFLGLGLGAEVDLIAFLVSRYFGLRAFAQIYGYMFAIFVFGSGVGPWLMGVCFDLTRSYNPALATFALALLIASFLISRLGAYAYPARARGASAQELPAAASAGE